MDFQLTDEQQEYQKLAREFAVKQMAPKAHHFDKTGEVPINILKAAWESGLLNVQLGDEFGGLGLGCLDAAVIAEELAAGCSGIASAIEANALSALPLLHSGSRTLKDQCLKPLMEEFNLAGFAADLFGVKPPQVLSAQRQSGGFALTGELAMVTNGGAGSWFIVLAGAGEQTTLMVVAAATSGVSVKEKPYLLGRRAADIARVQFDRALVPESNVVGTEGGAAAILDAVRPAAFALLSAGCVGIARCALENAVKYSKERHTFGQPIANHQGVQFMLADMAKDIEAARLLTWQAAALVDKGTPDAYSALVCRSFSQNMAMRAATDAVQVYGGYGYSKEYPVEKLMRDAKMYQLLEGTSAQLHVAVGQKLLSGAF